MSEQLVNQIEEIENRNIKEQLKMNNYIPKTHTSLVKEFTEESMGIKLPTRPSKMSKEEVRFIVRMVISELMELCTTVTPSVEDAFDFFTT